MVRDTVTSMLTLFCCLTFYCTIKSKGFFFLLNLRLVATSINISEYHILWKNTVVFGKAISIVWKIRLVYSSQVMYNQLILESKFCSSKRVQKLESFGQNLHLTYQWISTGAFPFWNGCNNYYWSFFKIFSKWIIISPNTQQ